MSSTVATVTRALVAVLILAALVTNAVQSVSGGVFAQYVSYFTNQSNLAFVLLVGAGLVLADRRPVWWDAVRGAVAFFLVMTGIIYALLVAPLDELLRWDIGWTGIVLIAFVTVATLVHLLHGRLRAKSPETAAQARPMVEA